MVSRRSILTGSAGVAGVAGIAGFSARAQAAANPISDVRAWGVEPDAPRDQTQGLQQAMDEAARTTGQLFLPPGTYVASGLEVSAPLRVSGIAGRTRLIAGRREPVLRLHRGEDITIQNLVIDGAGGVPGDAGGGVVAALGCSRLSVVNCQVVNGGANGLVVLGSTGRIENCTVNRMARAAIFANDCAGLTIAANHVHDCADNGILVWQPDKRHDGAVVSGNRIERIGAASGGSGQYGNGVNVFRAGGVTVSENTITDCAWSAVRNNAGEDVHIANNTCLRAGEVSVFCEFSFTGAVVTGNIIDTAAIGVSITNFNEGGRQAVCAGNIVRNLNQRPPNYSRNVGIAVEADTVVANNVVEATPGIGYALGWGPYARNISATGNIARQCDIGIAASVTDGAGASLIANNVISEAGTAAIVGMDHSKVVTGDLARATSVPKHLTLTGNAVS